MIAGTRRAPHGQSISASGGMAHGNSHCGTDAVVDAETEHTADCYYLESGEGIASNPACHNGRAGERGGLTGHLYCHGKAGACDESGIAPARGSMEEAVEERASAARAEENPCHGYGADDACAQRAYSCTGEAELGGAEMAEDEDIVEEDVKGVSREHYPRRYGSVVNGKAPLCQYVEDSDRQHAGQHYKIVGPD